MAAGGSGIKLMAAAHQYQRQYRKIGK